MKFTTTGVFTLEQQLSDLKVPELKEFAYALGFKYKSGAKKQGIVRHLRDTLLEQPQRLIKIAFSYELKAWLDAIEGRMTEEYADLSELLFALNRFKLMYALVDIEHKNTPVLHFVEELAEKLKPLIPEELDRREKDGSILFEKLALGCANIYGFTDMYFLTRYEPEMEKLLGRELDDDFILQAYEPVLAITHDVTLRDKPRPFLSPFAKINGFFPDAYHMEFGIEPKAFDIETILKYGEMPYPTFPIKEYDTLKEMIDKYRLPDAIDADTAIRRMWIDKQDEGKAHSLPVVGDIFAFKDIDQINECIKASVDFVNNVPYWRLRGNSSAEIGRKEMEEMRAENRMPKISIGPNMRAMGIESFEQLLRMAEAGEEFPFDVPMGKVGRNDPCPCGSGKKYKNCCGK